MIVFDNINTEGHFPINPKEQTIPLPIMNWDIEMEHINGRHIIRRGSELVDWSTDRYTCDFAGEIFYRVKINNPSGYHYIDLGKVYGVSEVTINGNNVGNQWYGRHLYQIPESLLNDPVLEIEIKLTTTTGNYLKSLDDNRTAQTWTHRQEYQPMGILGPVQLV